MQVPENLTPEQQDEFWMQHALELAQIAEQNEEVPVAAVLVKQGKKISEGINAPIALHDATAHAEVLALRQAGARIQNYRLIDTTLYVTLEPCPMCAGALVHARVARVVYGAPDLRTGSAGSVFNLLQSEQLNHCCEISAGVLEEACRHQLQTFFKKRRLEQKQAKQNITENKFS